LRAVARRFGWASLGALAVLIVTGAWMASDYSLWDDGTLHVKLALVVLAGRAGSVGNAMQGLTVAGRAKADPVPPALPERPVPPSDDSALIAGYRQSLDTTERAFSRDAQQIGLEQAFVRYGGADAMNMGGAARSAFVVGPDSIGAVVAQGEPSSGSSVSWAPDQGVIVASSGDLGVTIGTIVVNEADSTGQHPSFPFFTVWRRAGPDQPWRYVAE